MTDWLRRTVLSTGEPIFRKIRKHHPLGGPNSTFSYAASMCGDIGAICPSVITGRGLLGELSTPGVPPIAGRCDQLDHGKVLAENCDAPSRRWPAA
jgi:hypothetical protein